MSQPNLPPPPPPGAAPQTGTESATAPPPHDPTSEERASPQLVLDRWYQLDRAVVIVWRAALAIGLGIPVAAGSLLGALFLPALRWVPAALLVTLFVLCVGWYPRAKFRRWRWRLTDIAVDLEHGVFVRRREAIPYFRVQQIDIARGPLDRLVGLASLDITTASASGSVQLPGITADLAPGVRREVLQRSTAVATSPTDGVGDAV